MFGFRGSIACSCMLGGNAVWICCFNNANVAILHDHWADMISVPYTSVTRVRNLSYLSVPEV